MSSPYVFISENQLIQHLQSENMRKTAARFFEQRTETIREVIRLGVAGNTFRAFRNLKKQPSTTFRTWADNHLQRTLPKLKTLSLSDAYANYVHEATESLRSHWQEETRTEIGYGRAAKLYNLVLKKLACLSQLDERFRVTFIALQHVPLDSYTIVGLREVAPELRIPRNATMKHVETREQYEMFQNRISHIARKAGVPAIYYDVVAWDMSHANG